MKEYPTYDVLGFTFDLNPSFAFENVKKLLPVLRRAQSNLNTLPKRILQTSLELEETLEAVEAITLTPHSPLPDTTTETCQKSKDSSKVVKTNCLY